MTAAAVAIAAAEEVLARAKEIEVVEGLRTVAVGLLELADQIEEGITSG